MVGVKEGWENGKKIVVTHSYKRAVHFMDFLGTRGAARVMDKLSDYHYMIGHVRASTMGADKDYNAHPFEYDHIILVHNGTITNHHTLEKAIETVDSAAVAANMAAKGELETLEKLDGGYSLVWYNAKDDSLNFARNDRKPMAIAFVKGKNEMFFSSEYSTLWNVLSRNGLEIDGAIQIPEPGKHYKFYKESVRNFDFEGYKLYTPPSRPLLNNESVGWQNGAKVHRSSNSNKTGTESGANAPNVLLLPAPSPAEESAVGATTRPRANSKFFNPPVERQVMVTKKLEPFGFKYDQPTILMPLSFEAYQRDKDTGMMHLRRMDGSKELDFRMSFVGLGEFEAWRRRGQVACKVRNIMDALPEKDGVPLKIVVVHDPELQGVLDRRGESAAILHSLGFDTPKEGSKSTHGIPFEPNKPPSEGGEEGVIDAEIIENDNTRFVEGPNGGQLAWGLFRELCERGCGFCDDPVDPTQHLGSHWYNDSPLCDFCWASKEVRGYLQLDTEIKDAPPKEVVH